MLRCVEAVKTLCVQGNLAVDAPEHGPLLALFEHTVNGGLLWQVTSAVISDILQDGPGQLAPRGQLDTHRAQHG